MGFFDRFFKKKLEVEIQDPVFGDLTFTDGSWVYIPKTANAGFMVSIDATECGPTDRQRDFFQRIRGRLPDLVHRAIDYMRRRVGESIDLSRLSVYSVEIGTDDETGREEFVLELSDDDAFIVHRVAFRAGEPFDYGAGD
jgi:hypothetical protein